MPACFSLIVPTRHRPQSLRRLLASVEQTAAHPQTIEVVLVVDDDDPASLTVGADTLPLKRVVVPPGQTMGALNMAGYQAATGRYLMLLNDDVLARTPAWDTMVRACFEAYPDQIVLMHVNDTVFRQQLCTFPIVSRRFCELAGGICPRQYLRYRIDDHIEDVFNLLGVLGERRILYLPDVIFEHRNFVTHESGLRQYFSDPDILRRDAPTFEQLLAERKELALRLKGCIDTTASRRRRGRWQKRLRPITDSFALRRPERRRILDALRLADPGAITHDPGWLARWGDRLRANLQQIGPWIRERGIRGVARAVARRMWF